MRAREFLSEAALSPSELFNPKYLDWRPKNFLQKLIDRTPFVAKDYPGIEFIPEPGQAPLLKNAIEKGIQDRMSNPSAPVPSLAIKVTYKDANGQVVKASMPVSKFEKADLQTPRGQFTQAVNVQPIGIGIAADPINPKGVKAKDKVVLTPDEEVKRALDAKKAILAKNLYSTIAANDVLENAGPVGTAIKQAAAEIYKGQLPDLSKCDEKTQKLIAIDAGEYLGILEMVHDVADFPKKQEFLKFINAPDLSNLTLIFPGEQNSALSDSYGVQNSQTGQTLMISSKGGIGKTAVGAAPAISGLTLSEKFTKKVKPGGAIDFIQLIQNTKVVNQPMAAMNFLNHYYPESVPTIYRGILPFSEEDFSLVTNSIKTGSKLPAKFQQVIKTKNIKGRSTQGGIFAYATIKDFVEAFNATDPIPNFRQTILELLDENFVQIFSRVVGKKLTAKVLWPGKIDGNVYLHTKAEAGNPANAGLSFKVTD